MKKLKTVAFPGFEKQIRDARLTQSAMIGEAIGNGLAETWFEGQRFIARIDLFINAKFATLKHALAKRSHTTNQRRITATPH